MGNFSWSGLGWRVGATGILGVLWLAFIIYWLFFYAINYNIYQNIAIFIISLIVLGVLKGILWMTFVSNFKKGFFGKGECECHSHSQDHPPQPPAGWEGHTHPPMHPPSEK